MLLTFVQTTKYPPYFEYITKITLKSISYITFLPFPLRSVKNVMKNTKENIIDVF